MNVSVIIGLIGITVFPFYSISQTNSDSIIKNDIPSIMVDASYSNNYSFFNSPSQVKYTNGDIALKLNNDFEMNVMGLLSKNAKSRHHMLYGGAGMNFSEYTVNRTIYNDQQSNSGHFPMTYSYNPNQLHYNLQAFRCQVQLCHYGFYKSVIVFQKIGLAYTTFLKKR